MTPSPWPMITKLSENQTRMMSDLTENLVATLYLGEMRPAEAAVVLRRLAEWLDELEQREAA